MARNLAKLLLVGVLLASGVLLPGCAGETQAPLEPPRQAVSLDELPEFSGDPFVEVNGNVPSFSEAERDLAALEAYAPLDGLGRCGTAFALIGPETMPTEERGSIGSVKPSGWHLVKYDIVDGAYLYNRCHLIGYQLTGEGADELFGGYTIYNEPHVFKAYQKILPSKFRLWLAKEVKKLPHFKGQSFIIRGSRETEEKFIGNAFMYDDEDKRRILKDPSIVTRPQSLCKKFYDRVRGYDQETKMQYLDINLWMVGDILLKADRMSMANSLELRVPFLDKEVFKVASKLPTRLRVNKKNTKYAMRQAANRHLPQETAQKEKLGFPVPTRVWLRDEKYYNIVKEKFHSETAKKFFNTDVITQFLDDHYHNKDDNSRKVWTIYIFLVWYDIYFGDPNDVTPR